MGSNFSVDVCLGIRKLMKKLLNILCGFIFVAALVLLHVTPLFREDATLLMCSFVLFVCGLMFTKDGDALSKMWQSFVLYILGQALLWHFLPQMESWSSVPAIVLFLLVGLYHTSLIDEKEIFSEQESSKAFSSGKKYLLWGGMSAVSLFIMWVW